MAKATTRWYCTSCGADSPKWVGRCPSCGEWNTMVEERVPVAATGSRNRQGNAPFAGAAGAQPASVPQRLCDITASEGQRIHMPSEELNRVLGGGLVPGSLVLIGGEPGIGKSTLVLQNLLSIKSKTILYVSGEESATQIRMRADRIGRVSDNTYLVCETSLERVFQHVEKIQPGLLVVDSIQTLASEALDSAPGSVGQIRECAAWLLRYAKTTGVPVILIGHITKEGALAGPKVLEHIVDAVLQFEGDGQQMYRLLRGVKNRFGNTSEIGVYEMCQRGLREVTNPSEMLMSHTADTMSGIATGVTLEGLRPWMVEVQALVSTAAYGTPQRAVTGFDGRRLNMLLAVLEKRVGFKLAAKDVFLNIAGGLRVSDPALDLAVVAAVMSSNIDTALGQSLCMAGEVGLSGEIRPVTRLEGRIREADRLGMRRIIVPKGNLKGVDLSSLSVQIQEVSRVDEALKAILTK